MKILLSPLAPGGRGLGCGDIMKHIIAVIGGRRTEKALLLEAEEVGS